MGGWMGCSVGQWVGSGHITKYPIILDLIEIIQFCLKIYDLLDILDIFLDILLKPPQPLMGLFLKSWNAGTFESIQKGSDPGSTNKAGMKMFLIIHFPEKCMHLLLDV